MCDVSRSASGVAVRGSVGALFRCRLLLVARAQRPSPRAISRLPFDLPGYIPGVMACGSGGCEAFFPKANDRTSNPPESQKWGNLKKKTVADNAVQAKGAVCARERARVNESEGQRVEFGRRCARCMERGETKGQRLESTLSRRALCCLYRARAGGVCCCCYCHTRSCLCAEPRHRSLSYAQQAATSIVPIGLCRPRRLR